MLGTYKGKKLEEFLENTDNPYLKEYRREFHTHPIRVVFRELSRQLKIKLLSILCKKDVKQAYKRRIALDKKWIIELINEFRRDRKLSEHSTKVVPILIDNHLACIDEKIALTIFSLNKLGIKTSYCCHGHKYRNRATYAYVSLSCGYKFPNDLIEHLEENNIKYRLYPQEEKSFNGECLYSEINFDEFNELFVNALNDWALKQNNLNLSELKKSWKNQ